MIVGILVGSDPGSVTYLRIKRERCQNLGIAFRLLELAASITTEYLLQQIAELNDDPEVTGVIVQLPLPGHIDRDRVLIAVRPVKDIDAFCYSLDVPGVNLEVRPPTPAGMLMLLDEAGVVIKNK